MWKRGISVPGGKAWKKFSLFFLLGFAISCSDQNRRKSVWLFSKLNLQDWERKREIHVRLLKVPNGDQVKNCTFSQSHRRYLDFALGDGFLSVLLCVSQKIVKHKMCVRSVKLIFLSLSLSLALLTSKKLFTALYIYFVQSHTNRCRAKNTLKIRE